jgi:hypothetical protein
VTQPIERGIERVFALGDEMIEAYESWGVRIQHGSTEQHAYTELLEFVNFRMETADSCLQLIKLGRVADALGLCRSLLENYLLFILMCRGRRFFQLENQKAKSGPDFREYLVAKKVELEALRAEGKTSCLAVEEYEADDRCLMYIYEGFTDPEVPGFIVPAHYFHFQEFRPETANLKRANYFSYYPEDPTTASALNRHVKEAKFRYKHYLSYGGLQQCLEINGLADEATRARIDAHYTFLGQFLHPTYTAARRLHERDNVWDGGTSVGMRRPYTKQATLMAQLYVVHLMAGYIDEAAMLLESAPDRYVVDPGTGSVRAASGHVARELGYFWFIYNDAPLYDRFYYWIHAEQADRDKYPAYADVPSDVVMFNQHVYSHFTSGLNDAFSPIASYYSPLRRWPAS